MRSMKLIFNWTLLERLWHYYWGHITGAGELEGILFQSYPQKTTTLYAQTRLSQQAAPNRGIRMPRLLPPVCLKHARCQLTDRSTTCNQLSATPIRENSPR